MSKHSFSQMKYNVSMCEVGADNSQTPMPIEITLPEMIHLLRTRQKLSASALAKRCEVSRNYVGLIEKGKANPTLTILVNILEALGYTLTLTLEEKDA